VKYETCAPAAPTLTGQAVTMGTPAYMAPEVILGGGEIDRRGEDLDALVLDCLRKNPDEQPADAGALLRRLSRCDPGTRDQGSAQSWWEQHMPQLAGAAGDLRRSAVYAA
jgi:hypothetical protein